MDSSASNSASEQALSRRTASGSGEKALPRSIVEMISSPLVTGREL